VAGLLALILALLAFQRAARKPADSPSETSPAEDKKVSASA
jgi:hypothetical protein